MYDYTLPPEFFIAYTADYILFINRLHNDLKEEIQHAVYSRSDAGIFQRANLIKTLQLLNIQLSFLPFNTIFTYFKSAKSGIFKAFTAYLDFFY